MNTKKNHRQVKHVPPSQDRRAERQTKNLLKHAHQVADWDDQDISDRESRYRKRQDID